MPIAGKPFADFISGFLIRLPVMIPCVVGLSLLIAPALQAQQRQQIPASLFGLNPDSPQPEPQQSPQASPAVQPPSAVPLPPKRPQDVSVGGSAQSNMPESGHRDILTEFGGFSHPLQAKKFEPRSVKPPVPQLPQPDIPEVAIPEKVAVETIPAQETVPAEAEQKTVVQNVPLPPPAPTGRSSVVAGSSAPSSPSIDVGLPPSVASVPSPAAAMPVSQLSERQIIERANRYFNTLDTMTAVFSQVGGDGRRMTGTLYLQRPGRLRFAYDPPSTMEIVADGRSVAIRDSKLKTSDVYSINQTPLKFLLRDPINLATDLRVIEIEKDPTSIQITLEDSATLGGKSQITLFFDQQVQNLTRWRVVDAQGFVTTVILSQVERTRRGG